MSLLSKRASGKRRNSQEEARREWPADPDAYELLEEAGRGGAAVVYRARCVPLDKVVAVKISNLEGADLSGIAAMAREASLMRRFSCPNILTLHTSFVAGAELWMVMPLMVGSARAIMKDRYPEGLSEVVAATITREVLKGLDYVHKHGGIHRDVKAANILIGEDGSCLLADLGIATTMRNHEPSAINLSCAASAGMHRTFIGTPCWIAPEVIQCDQGYDTAADIWSLGITLLELASGRPPQAKAHPLRVLAETVSAPAPTLLDVAGAQAAGGFSRCFHDFVARCLEKEPAARPAAAELLQHKFIKQARDKALLQAAMVVPPKTIRHAGSGEQFLGGRSSAKEAPLARAAGAVGASSAPPLLSRPRGTPPDSPCPGGSPPAARGPSPLSAPPSPLRAAMVAVAPLPAPGDEPPTVVPGGGREKSGWLFDSQLLKSPPPPESLFPAVSESAAPQPASAPEEAATAAAAVCKPASPRLAAEGFQEALQARLRACSPREAAPADGESFSAGEAPAGVGMAGRRNGGGGKPAPPSSPPPLAAQQSGGLAWLVERLRLSRGRNKSGSSGHSSASPTSGRRRAGLLGSASSDGTERALSASSAAAVEQRPSREAVAAIFGAAPGLAWRGADKQ